MLFSFSQENNPLWNIYWLKLSSKPQFLDPASSLTGLTIHRDLSKNDFLVPLAFQCNKSASVYISDATLVEFLQTWYTALVSPRFWFYFFANYVPYSFWFIQGTSNVILILYFIFLIYLRNIFSINFVWCFTCALSSLWFFLWSAVYIILLWIFWFHCH